MKKLNFDVDAEAGSFLGQLK